MPAPCDAARMAAHDPALPARPWTRDDVPLVWRSDTCVEIGWPPQQVRLDGVDPAHVAWLLSLQGQRELADALALGAGRGLRHAHMRRLLRAGVRSGLIDDASQMPQSLRDAPAHLRQAIAADVVAARHLHGGTPRARDIIDRRQRAEVAIQGSGPVAEAVALVLTCSGVGSIAQDRATHSGSKRHRRATHQRACHVLCDTAHPDAAADPDAMALDIPHLAVAVTGARAVIGPLVIPGRTSCLRCRDLHLADADATWPRAAVQWAARRPGPAAAGLAHLSGAWAALHALAVIDAGSAEVQAPAINAALIVGLPDAAVAIESRPPHPLCGCLWPATGSGSPQRRRAG